MRLPTYRLLVTAVLATPLLLGPVAARAGESADPHAHCREMMSSTPAMKRATVTTARYDLPNVKLVRDDGKTVSLPEELADGRPVVLDFIFTTCTTICPVLSSTFSQLQNELGPERDKVHLVSISIDPEQDTPERLTEYARRFHAGPEWRHYTGSTEASVAVQRAFQAYRGDKMDHTPVTFIRAGQGKTWVRVDGFASPVELFTQLHQLIATR
jgi:protein SCO1/2